MGCTAIKIIKADGTIMRSKFMTVDREDPKLDRKFVDIDIFACNEEFIPIGTPSSGVCDKDEETYHRELRKEASERGQFVPEESTDPQWSPGYVEPVEEEPEVQKD